MEVEKVTTNKSTKSVSFGETTILGPVYGNYGTVASDFISKYSNSLTFGLSFVNSYFDTDCMCTLHIRHPQNSDSFETLGYANLQNKLTSIGIQKFKYQNYVQTSQPILNDIMTTLVGQISINDQLHSFEIVAFFLLFFLKRI